MRRSIRSSFVAVCVLLAGVRAVPAGAEDCANHWIRVDSHTFDFGMLTVNWSSFMGFDTPTAGVGRVVVRNVETQETHHSSYDPQPLAQHTSRVYELEYATDYTVGMTIDYDGDGSSCQWYAFAFRTPDPPLPCEFGIGGHVSTSVTTSSFTVSWQTLEPGTGRIEWKRTGSLDPWSSSGSTSLGTSHSLTATGLTAGTAYSYRILMFCPRTAQTTLEATGSVTTTSAGGGGGKGPYPHQPEIQLWPNPAAAGTTVHFVLPQAGRVRIDVYGVDGRRVASVVDRDYAAGAFQVAWSGRDENGAHAGAGVYFVRMQTGGATRTARLLLIGER